MASYFSLMIHSYYVVISNSCIILVNNVIIFFRKGRGIFGRWRIVIFKFFDILIALCLLCSLIIVQEYECVLFVFLENPSTSRFHTLFFCPRRKIKARLNAYYVHTFVQLSKTCSFSRAEILYDRTNACMSRNYLHVGT